MQDWSTLIKHLPLQSGGFNLNPVDAITTETSLQRDHIISVKVRSSFFVLGLKKKIVLECFCVTAPALDSILWGACTFLGSLWLRSCGISAGNHHSASTADKTSTVWKTCATG